MFIRLEEYSLRNIKKIFNIYSAFSMGNVTANPRYIKIGKPRVKHEAIKKTNLQKKALPLFDFSRPLQTPKNQAPFLALMILAMLNLYKIYI